MLLHWIYDEANLLFLFMLQFDWFFNLLETLTGKPIFQGVSIFVDGFTVPSSQDSMNLAIFIKCIEVLPKNLKILFYVES